MLPAEYATMAELEDRHWWYRALRERVVGSLTELGVGGEDVLLDVGCGTGGTAAAVLAAFPGLRYVGLDIEPVALACAARTRPWALTRGRADSLPLAPSSVDAVVSLDVLYYAGISMRKALRDIHAVLRPGGYLLLNLPALRMLSGRHDLAVGIPHRYGKDEVLSLLEEAGFEPLRATYWNAALFPVLLAWRWLSRLAGPGEPKSDVRLTSSPLDGALLGLMRAETALTRRVSLPFGSSVYVTARKPAS